MTAAAETRSDADVSLKPGRALPKLGDLPVHVALLVIGIIIALPIVIAFFMSFTPLREIVGRANPEFLPDTWTLENYGTAWNASPFGRYMLNSFIQTGIITVAQVILSVLAGYAFAMLEFRGKNFLFALVIGSEDTNFDPQKFAAQAAAGQAPLIWGWQTATPDSRSPSWRARSACS